MSVLGFYKDKNVLVSGTTGFLGKVILEKMLRALPQCRKLFILIRAKKGENIVDRFKKQVIVSPLFERLRRQLGEEFDKYVDSKIHLIKGDLLEEGLGLSQSDHKLLTEELHIIINSAASIDFNAPLYDAIQINVLGTLRMYKLATECKQVLNFLHISTSYVNSDKRGYIDEEIYREQRDAEEMIQGFLGQTKEELAKKEKQIINPFPNTYVFTKGAVERIIQKKRETINPNLTVTIVRPSIIGAAHRDPYAGWVENVTASSAIFLLGGIGMVKYIPGNETRLGDMIPVDFVSDYCIVAGALMANNKQLNVFHCGTSARNPLNWGFARDSGEQYWSANPPEKKVDYPLIHLIPNPQVLRYYQWKRRLPFEFGLRVAKVIGAKSMQKNMERVTKMLKKSEQIGDVFEHFIMNEWVFENKKCYQLISMMTKEENEIFQLDTRVIEWYEYMMMYHFGLHKYILGENVLPPSAADILSKQRLSYFSDVQWALQQGKKFSTKPQKSYRGIVLNSQGVQEEMQKLIDARLGKSKGTKSNIEREKIKKQVFSEAEYIAKEMMAEYNMGVLRTFGWVLHKIFKTIYEKVVVDDKILEHLRHHDAKLDGPLVLIPTHRSYIDFLIVSYIFFASKIQCPHIAAAEDFLKMALVPAFLRASGAFFLKRNLKDEIAPLYKAILYDYIQRLLMDDCYLEFFIEGTRSRNFKMQQPKFGVLNTIAEAVFDGKLQDAVIVPITINYEKVLEGDTYPYELMGEEKVRESLMRLMRASTTLLQNYGKIYIEIIEPISLKKYAQQILKTPSLPLDPQLQQISLQLKNGDLSEIKQQAPEKREIVYTLGYKITHLLSDNLVIMPTTLVASVLLMHRKGIMEQVLSNKVEWLCQEVIKRGWKVGSINEHSTVNMILRNTIRLMSGLISQNKKSVLELSVQPETDFKNTLMLNYYRNGLLHIFFNEAIVTAALCSYGRDVCFGQGVEIQEIIKDVIFLQGFLAKECVQKVQLTNRESIMQEIMLMEEKGVIHIQNNQLKIRDEKQVLFNNSLIWPLLEAYRTSILYLFTLQQKHMTIEFSKLPQYIQWFGKELYDDRIVEHLESCSLDTLKNAVSTFKEMGILKVDSEIQETGKSVESVVRTQVGEEELVSLEKRLSKFLKRQYATQTNNPVDIAKRTVFADYPFMSKL